MARTSTYPLVDRLMDGRLAEKLTEWRDSGKSYEDIAFTLRTEYDVKVSSATICRWLVFPATSDGAA